MINLNGLFQDNVMDQFEGLILDNIAWTIKKSQSSRTLFMLKKTTSTQPQSIRTLFMVIGNT
jgi:hypothetical protein